MNYLDELTQLNLPADQFAVFGSGPLAIRNLRKSNDIDLIVKEKLWQKLSQKYKVEDKNKIQIGHIEIYKDWQPWFDNINELIDTADIFNYIRFVKLDYVLKWKQQMNRVKDQQDIKLIKKYLRNNK